MVAPLHAAEQLDRSKAQPSAEQRIDRGCLAALSDALQKYFDLMYDCDTSRFDEVFASTVQLHGFRDGEMVMWSAETYRDILDKRQSPKSLNAARADEVLLVDFASGTQAFAKVRLKIHAMVFVDYLTWHRIADKWLITSKGFHLEPDENRALA